MNKKVVNVLIADDSKLIRTLLNTLFTQHAGFCVVGLAENGEEAVEMTKRLKPDVISMDIMMPKVDGFEATQRIMVECPTPIVIFSSIVSTVEMENTYKALSIGALAAHPKFFDLSEEAFNIEEKKFLRTMLALSEVHVIRRIQSNHTLENKPNGVSRVEVLAFGASTGGPEALANILPQLNADFPVPIVVVLHISNGFLEGFVKWLEKKTKINIKIAKNQEALVAGTLYFAPDDYHLQLESGPNGPVAVLDEGPPIAGFKPSVNALFESLAAHYPRTAVAGLLTGMGRDGADGLLKMRQSGCYTFAQSEETCVVPGMPNAARENQAVTVNVVLENMSAFFEALVKQGGGRDEEKDINHR